MRRKGTPLLPYSVIKAATCGDPIARQKVLKHYEGYICGICRRPYYDDNGNAGFRIDVDMKNILERELMHAILYNFKFIDDENA